MNTKSKAGDENDPEFSKARYLLTYAVLSNTATSALWLTVNTLARPQMGPLGISPWLDTVVFSSAVAGFFTSIWITTVFHRVNKISTMKRLGTSEGWMLIYLTCLSYMGIRILGFHLNGPFGLIAWVACIFLPWALGLQVSFLIWKSPEYPPIIIGPVE
jgi:hypothetical protein